LFNGVFHGVLLKAVAVMHRFVMRVIPRSFPRRWRSGCVHLSVILGRSRLSILVEHVPVLKVVR
jgi:hypothetical protein